MYLVLHLGVTIEEVSPIQFQLPMQCWSPGGPLIVGHVDGNKNNIYGASGGLDGITIARACFVGRDKI